MTTDAIEDDDVVGEQDGDEQVEVDAIGDVDPEEDEKSDVVIVHAESWLEDADASE